MGTFAIGEYPDESLLSQNDCPGQKYIIACDPLIYTIDHPDFIVPNLGKFHLSKRVKMF